MPARSQSERRISELLFESKLVYTTSTHEAGASWVIPFDNDVTVDLRIVRGNMLSILATADREPKLDAADKKQFARGKKRNSAEWWLHTAVKVRALTINELLAVIYATALKFGAPVRRKKRRGTPK